MRKGYLGKSTVYFIVKEMEFSWFFGCLSGLSCSNKFGVNFNTTSTRMRIEDERVSFTRVGYGSSACVTQIYY